MVRQKNDLRKKCDQDNRQQKYVQSRKEPKKFGYGAKNWKKSTNVNLEY